MEWQIFRTNAEGTVPTTLRIKIDAVVDHGTTDDTQKALDGTITKSSSVWTDWREMKILR
jgi:hypothetical protein